MDDGKVRAVFSWEVPQTVKELQRFLGFANFYRRFIHNYCQIAAPLTSLLQRKPKSLSWNPEASEVFLQLKKAFASAQVLCHPEPEKKFIVCAVLSQCQRDPSHLHPCAYSSRKLSPAERNYDIVTDLDHAIPGQMLYHGSTIPRSLVSNLSPSYQLTWLSVLSCGPWTSRWLLPRSLTKLQRIPQQVILTLSVTSEFNSSPQLTAHLALDTLGPTLHSRFSRIATGGLGWLGMSTEPGAAGDPPLPLLLDEGPVYAIHNILDSRRRRGRLEYLVDWEGYGPEDRSWVRRNDILDPDLLTEFHRTHASRPAPRSRGRPRRRTPLFLEAVPGGGAGGNVTTTPDSPPATSTISQSNSPIC
ncbi:hypothetical protein ACEWY4_016666 [Coilia grayii]|uniref:Chromo domain-containing protein n=1 Tax=Coilia grayii TaxID=363190 RepID=A0ABD1JL07_9TELE